VAKAETFSPGDFVDIFRTCEEGLRRHPGNASLYTAMGNRELYVGRMVDALTASSEAVQLDPQSPATLQNLISTYAYSGNANAAYATLRKAEQLWPNAPALVDARYRLDIRYGDPKEAMSMMDEGIVEAGLRAEQEAFLTARMDPTPENIEQAVAEDRKINEEYPNFIAQIAQTLAQFGRKDDVLAILLNYNGDSYDRGMAAEVLFRPAMRDVWRDPRSMAAAAHMGLLHYWKATGKWPDFCTDPTLPYDCRKEAAKYRV
jgi:tetratricopeptide (TPR) repeat protein